MAVPRADRIQDSQAHPRAEKYTNMGVRVGTWKRPFLCFHILSNALLPSVSQIELCFVAGFSHFHGNLSFNFLIKLLLLAGVPTEIQQ